MIPVYDGDRIVGLVEATNNLDYWDGRNFSCGSTGRHKGITQLESGEYVLVHTTQWQNERDWAEIISPEDAVHEILESRNYDLFDVFTELASLKDSLIKVEDRDSLKKSKVFSIRINKESSELEIEKKLAKLHEEINEFLKK